MDQTSRQKLQSKYNFDPSAIVGQEIPTNGHLYKLIRFLEGEQGRRGYAYEAFCEKTGHKICCKFYFTEQLASTPNWEEEFTKPNRVVSDDIAHYINHGNWQLRNINFTWIFYQWIDGTQLKTYISKYPDKVNVNFVRELGRWILRPLSKFRQANSFHGDIHMGNIMVSEAGDQDVPPRSVDFKLIDFGISASVRGLSPRDDFAATASLLAQLLMKINRGELSFEEQFFYDRFSQHYLKLLSEQEPGRDRTFKDPRLLYDELTAIQEESKNVGQPTGGKVDLLSNPFELGSADRFREDSPLLRQLFSRLIPGYNFLESEDNVTLTGPRGCGKTMILRNMALKTFLSDPNFDPSNLPNYIGFYIPAFELWITFPKRRIDDKREPNEIATDDFQKKTLHYFHLCLLEEVFSTLEQLSKKVSGDLIPPDRIQKVADFLNANFRPYQPAPGNTPLTDLRATVEAWRADYRRSKDVQLAREDPGFLRDLCRCLNANIPLMQGKRIFFLLDDYSLGKITPALQLSLNRVIFQRNPEFEFKVAAEKEAILLQDIDGPLDPSRAHFEIDLGYHFTSPDSADNRLQFLTEVFNNRFRYTENIKYFRIDGMLGKTKYKDFTQFALVLAGKGVNHSSEEEHLKRPVYHGVGHLAEICSGDIAAMISLVREILIQSHFDLGVSGQGPIDVKVQDLAIKNYSRMFLEQVGGEQKYSDRARLIAKAFGEMAQWKLKNQPSRNEGRETPFQATRLEVYEDSVLTGQALELYAHLLRYATFIQEPRGFGQGETTSKRLYFRRLFLPSFGLSFSRRDCIRLHMKDFIKLLSDPPKAKSELIRRWEKKLGTDVKAKKSEPSFPGFEEGGEFD